MSKKNDNEKPTYEAPALIPFGVTFTGQSTCSGGTGPTGGCNTGGGAPGGPCTDGSGAQNPCSLGSGAEVGGCADGSGVKQN